MLTTLLAKLRQLIRDNRSRRPFAIAAHASEKYLRAHYNEAFFDFSLNGEYRIIETFASINGNAAVTHLDVGAHTGEWTESILAAMPSSRVICFEVVPNLASLLRNRLGMDDRVTVIDRGLSSREGEVSVTFNKSAPSTSAIVPRTSSQWFSSAKVEQVSARVEAGDNVVEGLGLSEIGIMKIDVEGHEIDVLQGFQRTLRSVASPRLIQFEYGDTYLPVRHTLKDACDLLTSCGYVVGRVFPRGVGFKTYELSDDHFRMGNYVAVKAHDPLRRALQGWEVR
jgi:FkbM family methyltransferase